MASTSKIWIALRNTVVNWPPLILFVACLITLSGVTFVLGAYVYNTEDILDRDSLSWNAFLGDMERHGFCPHAAPAAPSANATTPDHLVGVSLLLPAVGAQHLAANASVLTLEESRPAGLNVSLEPMTATAGGAVLLCVRVTGPAAGLPRPGRTAPPACDASAAAGPGSLGLTSDGACAAGAPRYRLKYTAAPAWELTLSMVDRERVYAHLSCTSVFLMVMAVCMLLCTLVRNRSRYTLTPGDKVPLSDG
ncbi:uncharacterized protein LOC119089615 isoform X2 [Pollicipes pollicipes]|uniref:uncharacterized protein LOC119089615 isoform X2 n=1 Tax=Pollicipes pollicipes TaxID=41117 RepID=UPI0018856AC7|nr:uncharacterized protein LOC119089615 isoform X2 [Pollicipes pollicipes]